MCYLDGEASLWALMYKVDTYLKSSLSNPLETVPAI